MITEDYCSFEVAKLLKEKGFNEQCRNYYVKEHDKWIHRNTYEYNYFNLDVPRWEACYACPTHQMAMKWLREDKYIFIEIKKSSNTFLYGASIMKDCSRHYPRILNAYNTYEELVEAALKYALENLI